MKIENIEIVSNNSFIDKQTDKTFIYTIFDDISTYNFIKKFEKADGNKEDNCIIKI